MCYLCRHYHREQWNCRQWGQASTVLVQPLLPARKTVYLPNRFHVPRNRRRVNPFREVIVTVRPDGNGVKYDYYLNNTLEASVEVMTRVAVASHRVKDCFRRAKEACASADYGVQTWYGWHRHVTFSLLACWFLTKETMRGKKRGVICDGVTFAAIDCGVMAASSNASSS